MWNDGLKGTKSILFKNYLKSFKTAITFYFHLNRSLQEKRSKRKNVLSLILLEIKKNVKIVKCFAKVLLFGCAVSLRFSAPLTVISHFYCLSFKNLFIFSRLFLLGFQQKENLMQGIDLILNKVTNSPQGSFSDN